MLKILLYISVLLSFIANTTAESIEKVPLPPNLKECFKNAQNCTNVTDEDINNYCIGLLERAQDGAAIPWHDIHMVLLMRSKRAIKKCGKKRLIRKEIRRLTTKEWKAFTDAVNALKDKGDYDRLAAMHRGRTIIDAAHFGPNFLGWHRVYLLLFEFFLQRERPCVTIPYWYSPMDYDMTDPSKTILFTKRFFGNGDGIVIQGPFANWRTGRNQSLMRNIASDGTLISKEFVDKILTRTRHSQIFDTNDRNHSVEQYHNGPHVWVDGQMTLLDEASEDPVFWTHHAFIDCWWQAFIEKNKKGNKKWSYNDYPTATGLHAPGREMDPFAKEKTPGRKKSPFKGIKNRDGYKYNLYEKYYKCDPFPSCSSKQTNCHSQYLYCNKSTYRCVSKSSTDKIKDFKSLLRRLLAKIAKLVLPYGRKIKCIFKDKRDRGKPIRQGPVRLAKSPDFKTLDLSFISKILALRRKRSTRHFYSVKAPLQEKTFNCDKLQVSSAGVDLNSLYPPGNGRKEDYAMITVIIKLKNISKSKITQVGGTKHKVVFIQVDEINIKQRYKIPLMTDKSSNSITTSIAVKKSTLGRTKVFISAFKLNGDRCHPECIANNETMITNDACSGMITLRPSMGSATQSSKMAFSSSINTKPISRESCTFNFYC